MAKIKIAEVRGLVREAMIERKAASSKALIESILSEKEGFLNKLASKLGINQVDPSNDVDDPKSVETNLQKSFDTLSKLGAQFKEKALKNTREINAYHEAVADMMDKVTSLSDTLGPDRSKVYHSKMINTVRDFYKHLKDESNRIESFLTTVKSDLKGKGVSPAKAYGDTSGLSLGNGKPKKAPEPSFKPKKPGDMVANGTGVEDDDLKRMIGQKPTWAEDPKTPKNDNPDVDDDDAIRNFLKGGKKKSA